MADKDEWADFDDWRDEQRRQDDADAPTTRTADKAAASKRQQRKAQKATAKAQAKEARQDKEEARLGRVYSEGIPPAVRAGGILIVIALIVLAGWFFVSIGTASNDNKVGLMKPGQTGDPLQSSTPTSTYVAGTNEQVAPGGQFTLPPAAKQVDIPTPGPVSADPNNADAVATAWAKGYLSRPAGSSKEWQDFIRPYTAPELLPILDQLAFRGNDALAGKEPTQVTNVKITAAGTGEPVDTPARWSRTVDVDVLARDGSTTVLTYAVTAYKGGTGWQITDAVQKFWTLK